MRSGAAEVKYKDKGKKFDEIDDNSGDDRGDSIRRQGRTGRGLTSTRSLIPVTIEKHVNMGTAKQLRTDKLAFDKIESKIGQPPTRKLEDRKSCTRQKHTIVSAAADFSVGSDDGHEELLAAAIVVTNPTMTKEHWGRSGNSYDGNIVERSKPKKIKVGS